MAVLRSIGCSARWERSVYNASSRFSSNSSSVYSESSRNCSIQSSVGWVSCDLTTLLATTSKSRTTNRGRSMVCIDSGVGRISGRAGRLYRTLSSKILFPSSNARVSSKNCVQFARRSAGSAMESAADGGIIR